MPKLLAVLAVLILGPFFSIAAGALAWGALSAGDRWGILQRILVLSMAASGLVGAWSLLGSRFLTSHRIAGRLDKIYGLAWITLMVCMLALAILAAFGRIAQ